MTEPFDPLDPETIENMVRRTLENNRIARSVGLPCCIICGELIADWNPDPPRYPMHDYCDLATRNPSAN